MEVRELKVVMILATSEVLVMKALIFMRKYAVNLIGIVKTICMCGTSSITESFKISAKIIPRFIE